VFDALAGLMLGDLARSRAIYAEAVRALTDRGNLHAAVTFPLIGRAHLLDLADGRPDAARDRVRTAIGRWGGTRAHLQHVWVWLNETDVWLYEGRGAEGWDFCRENRPAGDRVRYLDDFTDAMVHWTWARAAVAAAAAGADVRRGLAEATRAAAALGRYRDPHPGPPLGWTVRAAVADLRGDRAAAVRLLARAEAGFDRRGLAFHAAAARYRRGRLEGGPAGASLCDAAAAALRAAGVQDPTRFVAVYAPGFRA
jgi:hypothetical protein